MGVAAACGLPAPTPPPSASLALAEEVAVLLASSPPPASPVGDDGGDGDAQPATASQWAQRRMQERGLATEVADCGVCARRLQLWAIALDEAVDKDRFTNILALESEVRTLQANCRVLEHAQTRLERDRAKAQEALQACEKALVKSQEAERSTSEAFEAVTAGHAQLLQDLQDSKDMIASLVSRLQEEEDRFLILQQDLETQRAQTDELTLKLHHAHEGHRMSSVRHQEELEAFIRMSPDELLQDERKRSQEQMARCLEEHEKEVEQLQNELEAVKAKQAMSEEQIMQLSTQVRTKDVLLEAVQAQAAGVSVDCNPFKIGQWLDQEVRSVHESLAKGEEQWAQAVASNVDLVAIKARTATEEAHRIMALSKSVLDNPAMWCVTMEQIKELRNNIQDDLEQYCGAHHFLPLATGNHWHVCLDDACKWDHRLVPHKKRIELPKKDEDRLVKMSPGNMHVVVDRYIRPQCVDQNWALTMNPGGRFIDVFVTHAWNQPFVDLVDTLDMAVRVPANIWISAFAMPQIRGVGNELGPELTSAVFARALQEAKKCLMIVDSGLEVVDRAWCAYEIAVAIHCDVPVIPWFEEVTDLDALLNKLERLNVFMAKTTFEQDRLQIQEMIAKHFGGPAALNERIRQLLGERLRFYFDFVHNRDEEFAEFQRQLELARQAGDADAVKDVLARRRSVSRQVGAMAEKLSETQAEKVLKDHAAKHPAGGPDADDRLLRALEKLEPSLAALFKESLDVKKASAEQEAATRAAERKSLASAESELEKMRQLCQSMLQEIADLKEHIRLQEAAGARRTVKEAVS